MNQELYTQRQMLRSVEELSAALSGRCWDVDFRQLDRISQPALVAVAASRAAVLLRVDTDNRVHQLAMPDDSMVHFGLPTRPQADMRFGRRVGESDTLTLIDSHGGLNVVSPPGFSVYTFSIRHSRLRELAESAGIKVNLVSTSAGGCQRKLPARVIRPLRRMTGEMLIAGSHAAPRVARSVADAMESDLALQFISAFEHGLPQPRVSRSNRNRALRRALACINEHRLETLSIEELCRQTSTSLSTLQRAFRDHFGLSPKQYLTTARLSGVRRALLDSREHRSIGDIAASWGFWHLSKFSADYKRMYGELPSATRRAA